MAEPQNQLASLYRQDILSVDQFSRPDLEALFSLTEQIIKHPGGFAHRLDGAIMSAIFYEASTRTSSSFLAAQQRLGGGVIPITGVQYSSVSKGETLDDTIRTLGEYSDVIVIRHPEVGAARQAADATHVPVINAGDGIGEHPTQALLDAFTIYEKLGNIDDKTVTMVGDLKHGRTVHSLARLLTNYDNVHINFVAPEGLQMPNDIRKEVEDRGIASTSADNVTDVIGDSDVVYVTRVQKERFESDEEYQAVNGSYTVTPEVMEKARHDMILMHPLPRVGEIATSVDSDPRAAYFDQVRFGMYVRAALLSAVQTLPN